MNLDLVTRYCLLLGHHLDHVNSSINLQYSNSKINDKFFFHKKIKLPKKVINTEKKISE